MSLQQSKIIKVICISPVKDLIMNKVYDATLISDWDYPLCYRLKDEKGIMYSYSHKSFATLTEYRKLKLEKIERTS